MVRAAARRVVAALGVSAAIGIVAAAAALALQHPPQPTTLRIVYRFNEFPLALTYTLACRPPSGTLRHPRSACRSLERAPGMVFPPPPPPSTGPERVRSCPLGSWFIEVSGQYRGRVVNAHFGSTCDPNAALGQLWRRYLPADEELRSVRLDHGIGPLELGQTSASVRALLGAPNGGSGSVWQYRTSAVLQFHEGAPVILDVVYGPDGRASSLIYNGSASIDRETLRLPPPPRSFAAHWPSVTCGGHEARGDHPLRTGRATTIVWASADHPSAIVTDDPRAACAVAAALAPTGCGIGEPCGTVATPAVWVRRR
jgi:hypothetical protein